MKLLYRKYKEHVFITVICIVSTVILWLPFLLRSDSINGIETTGITFDEVRKNWDGPLYIIPAKTLYDKSHELAQTSPLGLSPVYFSAHFPLYPLTIRALAPLVGYTNAMLFSTIIAAVILFNFFYYVVKKLSLSNNPLILTLVFMIFTPRLLVARSVGSPEPLFLLLILASLFFFAKKKYALSAIAGSLSILTKSPGGLLFFAYALYAMFEYKRTRKFESQWLWFLLIPLTFVGLCFFYQQQIGDFWAYFHSGDNIHLLFPPYQAFNYQALWVGTGWLEDVVFIYLFYGLTVMQLVPAGDSFHTFDRLVQFFKFEISKVVFGEEHQRIKLAFFYFATIFFIAIISVQHRDIARYSLPLLPIALITFEKFFTSRKFLIVLIFVLPAVYAFAWNFMLTNAAPITEWSIFM